MSNCQFPAKQWLAVRRTVAQLADETDDLGVVRLCCRMVLDIDQMRLRHADTGCGCWLEALAQDRFSINDAAHLLEIGVRL